LLKIRRAPPFSFTFPSRSSFYSSLLSLFAQNASCSPFFPLAFLSRIPFLFIAPLSIAQNASRSPFFHSLSQVSPLSICSKCIAPLFSFTVLSRLYF
jgi:hypothetical protein